MKKIILLSIAASIITQASTLSELFEALKNKPVTKVDEEILQIAKLKKQRVKDEFYPKFNLFATYEHYNSYTNLRPVPPNEANSLMQKREPLPFAKNIQRVGASFSMPLFVKELFTLSKKVDFLVKATKLKKELNIYKNEAIILASYANLNYIDKLQKALKARKRSLLKTYEDIKIKVKNQRAAPIALDKINSALDSIDIAMQKLMAKKSEAIKNIESLTGINVKNIQNIIQKSKIKKDEIFAIKPLKAKLKAAKLDLQAKKEKFLPKLLVEGKWSENYAQKDVIFQKDVHRDYGSLALKLVLPLSKGDISDIEIAKKELLKENYEISKTKLKLKAQAKAFEKQLNIYDKTIQIAKKKIKREKNLLTYAKTAFEVGRITEEEYLRYEDSLLNAQANLEELKAKKWQTLAKLAVIYGNDLERIVE